MNKIKFDKNVIETVNKWNKEQKQKEIEDLANAILKVFSIWK